ncbi:MAG: alpha-galactosidase [Bryobacteraceae bacterium]|nr:alpha-galactosidase [Bryobacteraceae bacterium]
MGPYGAGLGQGLPLRSPVFEVDGAAVPAALREVRPAGVPRRLANGAVEYRFAGPFQAAAGLSLELVFRVHEQSPVVRFRYILRSGTPRKLTKSRGRDAITYAAFPLGGLPEVREVRLSEFLEVVHSYTATEREVAAREFENELTLMGPILAASDGRHSLLAAYEHGSQAPETFLHFRLEGGRGVRLEAVKANYLSGQALGPGAEFETIWFEAAAVNGGWEELRSAYRAFVLKYLAENPASRRPLIFYNTWNFQERNKFWNGKSYLDSMNNERLLPEIDAAHRMGIEVFVMDTGWYEKTGDWAVSRQRFPDGLAAIRRRLQDYGMRLGLWFSPQHVAVSSPLAGKYAGCRMSWRGRPSAPHPVWETESSYRMCLVSPYSDVFADALIRLHRELGVTYFKWDAVDQHGCDDPRHWHGDESHSAEERAESYAFQLPLALKRIAERVAEAAPEAILDFDVTEAGRSVGLAFLSAGKYFLINNGPYYQNYNVPINPEKDNWNLFFHPGPARTWICRTPLSYDAWIPSVLFLTHYFPDDPSDSQIVNLASLILGQNGIWGDLLKVSPEGAALFGRMLGWYRQVREDITEAPPVRSGAISGSAEVHEKISPASGRGAVVVFSTARGRTIYVTQRRTAREFRATEGVSVRFDAAGRARLELSFERPGAHIVFFGAR